MSAAGKLHPSIPPSFIPKRKNGTPMEGEWHPVHKDCFMVKAAGYCARCNKETYLPRFSSHHQFDIECKFCKPKKIDYFKFTSSYLRVYWVFY